MLLGRGVFDRLVVEFGRGSLGPHGHMPTGLHAFSFVLAAFLHTMPGTYF